MDFFKKIYPTPQVKCDFAFQELPEKYQFKQFSDFVYPIDKQFLPYPNVDYITSKLIPHFKESLQILKKNINDLEKKIEYTKETAQNSLLKSQECMSNEYKLNFLNQEIIIKLKVLIPKKEELKRTLLFNQISFLEKRLELLKNIEKVLIYLISSPHYYYVNLQFLQKTIDFYELEPDVYLEYESITRKINFLESHLSCIQEPFLKYEENFDFALNLLSLAITLKIPNTKCIQNSEEIDLFRLFLESKNTPIHFAFYNTSSKDVDIQIKMMANCILNFCQILTYDDDLFDVLYFILIRFFFEIFFEKTESNTLITEKDSQIINNNLDNLKLATMKDLGLSSRNTEFLDLSATEIFEKNLHLKPLPSELMSCHFLINPIEIFFTIQKIGICLSNVFSNNNDLYVAWKALFIASSVPSVDLIFKKLLAWKNLYLILFLYDNVCEIPNKVLEELSINE